MENAVRQEIETQLRVREPILDQQFSEQASMFAHYGFLAADAIHAAKMAKLHAEVVEAQLTNEARNNLPKPSEWQVVAYVKSDPRYLEAFGNYHQLQHRADLVIVAKDGFAQRKEMLVSVGADLRKQRGGELRS